MLFGVASDIAFILTKAPSAKDWEEMSEPTGELTNRPFAAQLSNVYFSILALFCFKLFVKISLNLLAYFYIVRGNRKEAARISAEFYDYGQQHSEYSDDNVFFLRKPYIVVFWFPFPPTYGLILKKYIHVLERNML